LESSIPEFVSIVRSLVDGAAGS
ncbi:MAG: hypothetical protein RL441_5, partial [Actinomycetota bacterium]